MTEAEVEAGIAELRSLYGPLIRERRLPEKLDLDRLRRFERLELVLRRKGVRIGEVLGIPHIGLADEPILTGRRRAHGGPRNGANIKGILQIGR